MIWPKPVSCCWTVPLHGKYSASEWINSHEKLLMSLLFPRGCWRVLGRALCLDCSWVHRLNQRKWRGQACVSCCSSQDKLKSLSSDRGKLCSMPHEQWESLSHRYFSQHWCETFSFKMLNALPCLKSRALLSVFSKMTRGDGRSRDNCK